MSLLKQIDDKGVVLEWSPISSQSNLVAVGTKDSSGIGFGEYGGELELHQLDLKNHRSKSSVLLGKTKSNTRFSSLAWSQMAASSDTYNYGLIAGGMVDGFIHVWDPSRLIPDDQDALILSVEQHQGAVRGLQFNPHRESSHLLSSGGADGEVLVMNLERPEHPNVISPANNSKQAAELTKVAWNTQVAYILASASQNGSCFVWDLRQQKAWCELRDPSGGSVADIAWNPDQGLNIVTASGDDKNPVLKLWDLRSSTSLPLATLQGHTEGVLSLSWCPTDPSLLLSCGKDGKTLLWDLFNLQPVYTLPSNAANPTIDPNDPNDDQNVFGGLASSGGRRYQVNWSPCLPAVVSTCSFDRKVQIYSLTGAKSTLGRAPKWLRRPVGASFGFGGKLVTFDSKNISSSITDGKKSTFHYQVKISQVVEDPEIVETCDNFHKAIDTGDFKAFCEAKAQTAESAHDRDVWGLMKVICFEKNAREELLSFLGFSASQITALVEEYLSSSNATASACPPSGSPANINANVNVESVFGSTGKTLSTEDFFSGESATSPIRRPVQRFSPPPSLAPSQPGGASALAPLTPSLTQATAGMVAAAIAGEKAEPIIRKALLVGNFSAAVDCCLQAGLMAEALILAQCGDQSLWLKTQEAFFNMRVNERPFLSILHSIIKQDLETYVLQSDLSKWKETLALLNTYGKTDQFWSLCESLGSRLEFEVGDTQSAIMCYMCATNVPRTVAIWTQELKAINTSKGGDLLDRKALHEYIEKVRVFTHANPCNDLGADCSFFFSEYASILASQGRLDIAGRYLKGDNAVENILIDRLYHAGSKPAGSRPPAFPFTRVTVNANASPIQQTQQNVIKQRATTAGPHAGAHAGGPAVSNVTASLASLQVQANTAATQQQQHVPQIAPVAVPSAQLALPPGWLQLQDPSSGRPYYVNQATSQSQWEPPAAAPTVTAPPQEQPKHVPTAPTMMTQSTFVSPNKSLASLSSSTTVQSPVGPQYPSSLGPSTASPSPYNSSTTIQSSVMKGPTQSTAFSSSSQPSSIPAVAVVTSATSSSTIPAATSAPVVVDSEAVKALGFIINQLASSLSAAEKRQLVMVNQSYSNLCEKISASEVNEVVMQKLSQLVLELGNRNWNAANAIQTDLANTVWAQHKEWLKGVKVLIQLASKK